MSIDSERRAIGSEEDALYVGAVCDEHDEEALRTLIERHRGLAIGTFRKAGVPEHDTDDLFQEVWIHLLLHEKLPTLRERKFFRTWFRQICHNFALNYFLREKRRHIRYDTDLAAKHAAPVPADHSHSIECRELGDIIGAAVEKLRPMDRATFQSFYGDGYSISEIALNEGLPEGTVKRRLHTMRERLREHIVNKLRDEKLSLEDYLPHIVPFATGSGSSTHM